MYQFSEVMMTLVLALAVSLPAAAADKFDGDARARALAPYVDEQTVVVARVDLTRIDTDALLNWAIEVGRLEPKEIEESRREMRGWFGDLTKAGGKEMYVVVNLADMPNGSPLAIVPLAADVNAKAVLRVLNRAKDFEQLHFEANGQALLGGSAEARKRVQGERKLTRPELAKAFAAAGDTTAQLLLLPTADTRRVVDELLPMLPPQVGGGSTRPLTHGLLWAALSLDLPPKPSLRLLMQSPDADSAEKLKDSLVQILKTLAKQREITELLPNLAQFTPNVEGNQVILTLADKDLKAFLPIVVRRTHQTMQRRVVLDSLKRLVLAMQNYSATFRSRNVERLPAVANFDKQGKPLLSWRVHVLPFVGEQTLYKEFHLDESWDSPHNKKLLNQMPDVYRGPNRKLNAEGKTIYLLPVGKHAAFKDGPEGPRFPADFLDGLANTILIVEADDAHAVPWTKPEDLKIDPEHPERGLGDHYHDAFLVALADGSVRLIAKAISKATLRLAFDPADGQPMGSDW